MSIYTLASRIVLSPLLSDVNSPKRFGLSGCCVKYHTNPLMTLHKFGKMNKKCLGKTCALQWVGGKPYNSGT
jgi:hypothetical protein